MSTRDETPARRYERLRGVVERALELPLEERDAFLVEGCADDLDLLREARELLEVSSVTGFLASPLASRASVGSALPGGFAGRRVGEFELLEEIGRGGMGVVYRARQPSLDREVAVKLLANPLVRASPRALERFGREAVNVARLDHPGIVKVITHGMQDDMPFIAMELVRGESLADRVQREGRPQGQTAMRERCRWILEVALALDNAHHAEIVHRDVKPQNVLINLEGHSRLVDFGVARDERFGNLSRTGELIGTPQYMSPEQLRTERDSVDARTDIYSLGVVLFEALTSRRPFEGGSLIEMIQRIEGRPAPSLRDLDPALPRELDWIVQRAIEIQPEHRYGSAAEFAEDLEAYLERGETVHAGPRSRLRLLRAELGRWRGQIALGSSAALMLAVLLLVLREAPGPATAVSVTSEPEGAEVFAWACDPRTGRVLDEPARRLGRTPVVAARLPLGYWRLEALSEGRQVGESTILASDPKHPLELPAWRMRPEPKGMVRVPAGRVDLDGLEFDLEAFWIDATEVSNGAYLEFVVETGARAPELWPANWAKAGLSAAWRVRPVTEVSLAEAQAFAAWAGKRLPTFAEWLRAASGDEGWNYPWGDTYGPGDRDPERGNLLWEGREMPAYRPSDAEGNVYREAIREAHLRQALPVTQAPEHRSPFGLSRTLGNVREWTVTPLCEPTESSWRALSGSVLVAGGSWFADRRQLDLEAPFFSELLDDKVGFRCARSATFLAASH